MSDQNVTSTVRSLAVATLLSVAPFATAVASAQEAILLETIGAVRMAPPAEVRRMNADHGPSGVQSQNQRHHQEQDASAS